jgi:uncharacterized membrane-anchored protein
MQDFDPGQFGKWLIGAGLVLIAAGGLVMLLAKAGLFRLPGDLNLSGRNWRVFVPITTCIVLSVVLTLILWLVQYFQRK